MAYSAADYIIDRLSQHNVEALFGVPAVYCAALFAAAGRHAPAFRTVITSSDLEAGYAADAYARIRGLSVVSVAYGVGTLSLINAIAGAYIERSPVVVINGGPSDSNIDTQTRTGILFSHSMGNPNTDLEAFRPLTAYCERARNQRDIPRMVDLALRTALTRKHPVYLEIPQGLLGQDGCPRPVSPLDLSIPKGVADAAAKETVTRIKTARKPIVIVGIEVQRYGLADEALSFINKLGVSWTTTLLAKSTLPEQHPRFLGVFNGNHAPQPLRRAIADADLVVALGAVFGSGHAAIMLDKVDETIRTWDGFITWHDGRPRQALGFPHYVKALDKFASGGSFALPTRNARKYKQLRRRVPTLSDVSERAWDGDRGAPTGSLAIRNLTSSVPTPVPSGLTYKELFDVIGEPSFLDQSFTVIPDTFLGIYPAAQMRMPTQNSFIANALWASIGHSVGAAVGAAIPNEKRPLVISGDGGFQMTAQALSTMSRLQMNAIVIVVDNGLYGYEQWLLARSYYTSPNSPPLPYAVLSRWVYTEFAKSLGVSKTFIADDVAALRAALASAKSHSGGPALVHAVVQSRSVPQGL